MPVVGALVNMTGNTVLRDFGRSLREEPFKYIYRHKIWVTKSMVSADEVKGWLRSRYIESRGRDDSGARYEVRTYRHENGEQYVDYILLEKLSDTEAVFMALSWGLSDEKVTRDGRRRRPKLTSFERKELDARIAAYYDEVERRRQEA
jgi:hypothetical protein